MEGEEEGVEAAEDGALLPVVPDVVLHEEGRHETAIEQVGEGHREDHWGEMSEERGATLTGRLRLMIYWC